MSRGYNPHQLSRALGLAYCPEARPEFAKATGRIIIPVYMRGRLVGWQARFVGQPPHSDIPKYITMTGMKKSEALYNFDRAKQSSVVVVVEGASDVWTVGPRAVALFGKVASTHQVQVLTSVWRGKAVVVLLDADAEEQSQKLYAQLQGSAQPLVRVQLPAGRDPGSFRYPEIWQLIHQAVGEQGADLQPLLAAPAPAQGITAL